MIVLQQIHLAFYVVACISFGFTLMRLIAREEWRLENVSSLTAITIYFLLGTGVLAGIWTLIALLGWLSPWTISAVCGLIIVVNVKPVISLAKRLITDYRGGIVQFQSTPLQWKIIILLVVLFMLLTGIGSLLPPFSDAAGFYMSIAKITADSHRLLPMRGYFEGFSQIGLSAELHYSSLISLGSVEIAKEFNWLVGIAIAVMLTAICSKVGIGRRGKWIAVIMVLTSTAITHIIMNGKTDLFAASFGIAAFYWALEWRGCKQRHPVWLAGLFTGVAVIAKLSYAIALVPAILFLIAWRLASCRAQEMSARGLLVQFARTFLQFGFGMLLIAIPHILKSGLLFGQPSSPFFSTAGPAYLSSPRWFPPDVTRRLVLTYPVALILGYTAMQGGQLSPLLLTFLPLTLLLRKPTRFFSSPLVQLTVSAMSGVIVWVVVTPSVLAPRFILAPVLMFIPLLAKGTEYLFLDGSRSSLLKGGTFIVLLVSILFSMISVGIYAKQAIQIQVGLVDPCEYSRPSCWALSSLSQDAEMGSRIFLVESHVFWLRPDLLQCASSSAEMGPVLLASTAEEQWTYLVDTGFQYIAINPSILSTYHESLDISDAPEWLEISEIYRESDFEIYRISSKDPSIQPSMICRQIDSPAWEIVPVEMTVGTN